jgi:hypothetical protein
VIRVGSEHSCGAHGINNGFICSLLKPQNTKLDGFTSVEKLLKDGSQTIAACVVERGCSSYET